MSSVNEGKYRTVSRFSDQSGIESGEQHAVQPLAPSPSVTPSQMINPDMSSASEPVIRRMKEIMKKIHPSLALEVPDIKIIETGNGTIMISSPNRFSLQSGEARIRPEALPFLKSLAQILIGNGSACPYPRSYRQCADQDGAVPLELRELSAVRAVLGRQDFSELYEVPISHLSATGFADSKPVATNGRLKVGRKTVGLKLLFWRRA